MVAYKLSKNGWVVPFFVIFRLAREKLLVTVALDHPVVVTQRPILSLASVAGRRPSLSLSDLLLFVSIASD